MAISPVEQLGSIGRTQDFSILKQQEDMKEAGTQTMIQTQVEKNTENKLSQVRDADHSEMTNKKFDAKDKGDNQYFGDGGKDRKKQKGNGPDGRVVLKGNSSFDMKI